MAVDAPRAHASAWADCMALEVDATMNRAGAVSKALTVEAPSTHVEKDSMALIVDAPTIETPSSSTAHIWDFDHTLRGIVWNKTGQRGTKYCFIPRSICGIICVKRNRYVK